MIQEVDGIFLRVSRVDLKRPDAGGIVDGRVLKTFQFLSVGVLELEKYDIDLDMMTGNLFFISLGLDSSFSGIPGKSVDPVSLQNLINAGR